ncbi:MAG: hypothetical protein L3I99_01465 [Sulfurimonas sp.]|nr:hypothetical protein [Sulfurimonas sp.]
MGENTQQSFSNVVSINPYNDTCVNGLSSFLKYDDKVTFSKGQHSISYLNTKDFISTQISVSKNIPEEDIYDAVSTKAYDDLALDQAVSYQIQYVELYNSLDSENRLFNVFIVDPDIIKETFENTISKIKYIDTIIPSPLLIKSLYSKDLITSSDTHAFIYIQANNAFIAVYNDKKYIFSKTLEYSFIQLHEKFCELYGEKIEYNDFINFLQDEDLKTSSSPYKEFVIKLYKDIFANINDILTYVKRAYELKKIDCIYAGTQINMTTKLDEISEFELNIKSSCFEFDYGFESDEDEYIDQLHSLMHLYTIIPDEEKYICNFSIFERPPKFVQRDSGKLILVAAAALVLGFAYPVSYWVATYAQSLQIKLLNSEYRIINNKKITRETIIKNRNADKDKYAKLLNQEQNEFISKKETLTKIRDVKINYLMKAKILTALTKDLNKYKIRLESLSFDDKNEKNTFMLDLVSYKDVSITKLVKYLTKTHEGKINFSLKKIAFDEENKKYFSTLKVEIL